MIDFCGKFQTVQVANNPMNTLRNGSDEVGPVACQLFGAHGRTSDQG